MKLTTNTVITPRLYSSKGDYADYSYFDVSKRSIGGETIGRNIQWYRMWWMYLRLALECEEKGVLVDGEKIKMNRRYYRKWDLTSILEMSFDDWWKDHKQLFTHEKIKTSGTSGTNVSGDDHLVLMIPKTRDKTDLLKELDEVLEGKTKSVVQFPFSNSKATYLRCHMQYNIFVRALNGEKRGQIRQWVNKSYEPMKRYMMQTKFDNQGVQVQEIISADNGVTNNIRYAKKRVISTSKGIFP
jgi:hypothetical protein